jgi:hypothetical protein
MTDIEDRLAVALERRASTVDVHDDLDTILSRGNVTRLGPGPRRTPFRTKTMAAAAVLIIGTGGLVWIQNIRSESSTTDNSIALSRQSGSITDPKAIDLSPWLDQAPPWPTGQPSEYLVFDLAGLDGWTSLDQTGGHQIGAGATYDWFSNVTDPDGRQFNLSIRSAPDDGAAGEAVDINGHPGTASDGQVSWPIDDTHTGTVTEFGTAETDRVVAAARALTTTIVPTISARQPPAPTGVTVDPDAHFAGTVDGIRWSASATADSVHFILDDIADDTIGIGTSAGSGSIVESGGNDACIFVAGLLPTTETVVKLVLSTDATITLPTQTLDNGNDWFAACVPYRLDAVALDITVPGDTQAVRHPLQAPYLIPTTGSAASFTNGTNNVPSTTLLEVPSTTLLELNSTAVTTAAPEPIRTVDSQLGTASFILPDAAEPDPRTTPATPDFVIGQSRWLADCCTIGVVLQNLDPPIPDDERLGQIDSNDLAWTVYDIGPRDGTTIMAKATKGQVTVLVSAQKRFIDDTPVSRVRDTVELIARSLTRH